MPADSLVSELLLDLYPGEQPSVVFIRNELTRVASIPGPSVILLEGPPGSGKTTMARAIAVCRRLLSASTAGLPLSLDRARHEVLSQKPLTWYRDISLAGLVDTLVSRN